ncbi:uncharacterized protein LOC135461278 isoform X3 [Liolophura sinensis]|uniref:uncharacterized protein LOC135461278 isoform X3 n=1 Tax=Liolophura sinensis TaxID=3198878 RepID=UPI0031594423
MISCDDNQATLIWASGIDDSLVEYYNLEYKRTQGEWKGELVRNLGRVKLVRKTVSGLQSGVLYHFRLQPVSNITFSQYATANCTVQASQAIRGQKDVHEAGVSKGGMLAIGVVIGIAVVTIIVVSVTCRQLRKTPSTGNKEDTSDKQGTGQVLRVIEDSGIEDRVVEYRGIEDTVVEDTTDLEHVSHGHYEDLDTTPNPGPHYEELSGTTASSTPGENRVYENATVL